MTTPQDVLQWVRKPYDVDQDTFVDSTGQKWQRGPVRQLDPHDEQPLGIGSDLIRAARAAVAAGENQGVVFESIPLKRVND